MHLTEEGYKKWQDFQDKEKKKEDLIRIKNGNKLKPLLNYPKTISKNYILKINNLKIT